MPKVDLNGIVIHYQQMGEGPDLILVHGLFGNIAFWWQPLAFRLAGRFRVTALDLRGHGYSSMPGHGYRAIDLARDISALMDHLQTTDAHIVGHSFGGAIALACAVENPGRVSEVTLADAWIPTLQRRPPLPGHRGLPKLRRRLAARGIAIGNDLPRVAMAFLEEFADSPGPGGAAVSPPPGLGGWSTGARERTPHTVRRWQRLMAETTAWAEFHSADALEPERLSQLRIPVNLIYGGRSRYLASRDALARILPDARRIEVDGGGHYFPVLQPDALPDFLLGAAALPKADPVRQMVAT